MVMLFMLMILFISSVQPIMMLVSLIMITLMYSLMLMSVMGSYWFSYALMMVMLSGIMVVMTYIISLLPNEVFEMNDLMIFVLFVSMILGWLFQMYGSDKEFFSFSMWNCYLSEIVMLVVVFLFSIMMMVVLMSYKSSGALRIE